MRVIPLISLLLLLLFALNASANALGAAKQIGDDVFTLIKNDDQCLGKCEAWLKWDRAAATSSKDITRTSAIDSVKKFSFLPDLKNLRVEVWDEVIHAIPTTSLISEHYLLHSKDLNAGDTCEKISCVTVSGVASEAIGGANGDCDCTRETSKITGSRTELRFEKVGDFFGFKAQPGKNYYLHVVGEKKPMLGDNSFDWQMVYDGNRISEFAWWNAAWVKKRGTTVIVQNEDFNAGGTVCIKGLDVSGWGLTSVYEVRIVNENTLTELDRNVSGKTTSTDLNICFRTDEDLTKNTVYSNRFYVYYGNLAATAPTMTDVNAFYNILMPSTDGFEDGDMNGAVAGGGKPNWVRANGYNGMCPQGGTANCITDGNSYAGDKSFYISAAAAYGNTYWGIQHSAAADLNRDFNVFSAWFMNGTYNVVSLTFFVGGDPQGGTTRRDVMLGLRGAFTHNIECGNGDYDTFAHWEPSLNTWYHIVSRLIGSARIDVNVFDAAGVVVASGSAPDCSAPATDPPVFGFIVRNQAVSVDANVFIDNIAFDGYLKILAGNVGNERNNIAPDVNFSKVDGSSLSDSLKSFSYYRDKNLTIDFNVIDIDRSADLHVDINYSQSKLQGTGVPIVDDLNLTAEFCVNDVFTSITRCSWDWNIFGVGDGNYYLLIDLNDGVALTDFNASDQNFMVDNNAPYVYWDGNASGWNVWDANIHLTCVDGNSGCGEIYYRIDANSLSGIVWGGLTLYDRNIFIGEDGNWALDWNATDNAGNPSDVNLFYIPIDKNGPYIEDYGPKTDLTAAISAYYFWVRPLDMNGSGAMRCWYGIYFDIAPDTNSYADINAHGFAVVYTGALADGDFAYVIWHTCTDNSDLNNNAVLVTGTYTYSPGRAPPVPPGGGGGGGSPPIANALFSIEDPKTKTISLLILVGQHRKFQITVKNISNSLIAIKADPDKNFTGIISCENTKTIPAGELGYITCTVTIPIDYNSTITSGSIKLSTGSMTEKVSVNINTLELGGLTVLANMTRENTAYFFGAWIVIALSAIAAIAGFSKRFTGGIRVALVFGGGITFVIFFIGVMIAWVG